MGLAPQLWRNPLQFLELLMHGAASHYQRPQAINVEI